MIRYLIKEPETLYILWGLIGFPCPALQNSCFMKLTVMMAHWFHLIEPVCLRQENNAVYPETMLALGDCKCVIGAAFWQLKHLSLIHI